MCFKSIHHTRKMEIRNRIDDIFEEVVAIRRKLHANPELSQNEIKTAEIISEYLKKYNIAHENKVAGNGVVGIIEGKGKVKENQKFLTIGIRADIDALPIEENVNIPFKSRNKGVMHACGHDIHTAVLLGTARILKEMEDRIPGNIKLFFEPAEETVGGAKTMIEEGCLLNPKVDAVIGFHIAPEAEVGTILFRKGKMNAASTEFKIVVKGVSCHGAQPEKGIDTVLVTANLVCALQSIVSRNLSPTNPAVLSIGQIHGGNKNNIVAKETFISGIIRVLDSNTMNLIKKRIKKLSENLAFGFGAEVRVEFDDSYPVLANDDEIVDILKNAAEKFLEKEKICFLQEPSLGTDDFAYFSEVVKSAYFNIGCSDEKQIVPQVLHSDLLNPNEECIRTGIIMEVLGVLEILKHMN